MSDERCTDQYGTEIEVGDLVVSGGVVGMVSAINAHNAPTIRYPYKRKVLAYEWGAPDVERKGMRTKRDERGNPVLRDGARYRWDYEQEEYTYFSRDCRVVGEVNDFAYQVRQRTFDVTILRKVDGTVPNPFADQIETHKKIFPDKDVSEDSPFVG